MQWSHLKWVTHQYNRFDHHIYHLLCQQNIKQIILRFQMYAQISSYGVTSDVVCHNIEVKIGR